MRKTFIPIEQKLKELREGQMYFVMYKSDMTELLDNIPDEDLPLYLNANIQWMNEDGYLYDKSPLWVSMVKERLNSSVEPLQNALQE